MIRARTLGWFAAILLGGGWLAACVPALPGGALDETASGGSVGTAGTGGAPGRGGAPGKAGATGTGFGGAGGVPTGSGAIGAPPTLAGGGGSFAGSAGAGGDGMPATCGAPRCTPQPRCVAPPPIPDSISGFESTCGDLEPVAGRDGGWFVYATGSSIVDPSPNEPFRVACNGAGGSCYAGCIKGTLSGSGYPTVGIGFVPRVGGAAYDVSRNQGVSFALFVGEVGPGATLRFQVPLAADTMAGTGGGTCTTSCFDAYQSPFPFMPGNWFPMSIPFAALRQQGFGPQEPWDPASVISFQWVVAARSETVTNEPFFLCVDQVSLF